ncbi:Phage-related protein [Streptomyces sp. cf386]|uniref:phage tail protein n=1 Tax=Streptomyces sp. cf386 TaxID=1761904 RepID=UPI00088E98BC|nr:hypothetical protein [Streptomyces sp. cf386]SDM46241.1 Phage-related protein [Streptomyces sp. cf386]
MALTIGELVGLINADDSGMRRGLSGADLAMRGFQRDTEGRLRHLDGRFATTGELIAAGLREGTDEGDRFSLSLGRIAGMAGGLAGVAGSVGRIVAMLGAAAPAAAGLATTLANIAPAAGVAATGIVAVQLATNAVKIGMAGVSDAVSAAFDPSKAEEFEEALKKLSPNARAFVLELKGMSEEFDALKKNVQDRLFERLDEVLRGMAEYTLPVLHNGLSNAAGAVNLMARNVGNAAIGLSKSGTLGQAISSANIGLFNLSRIPGQLTVALAQVAAAAGPSFERLTKAAGNAFDKISERISDAFESGRMEQAIEDAIDLIRELVDVGRNVGRILGSVFEAAQTSGGGLIGTLKEVTGALADAFESPEVQAGLRSLFETMGLLAETAAPLLGQAIKMLAPILEELGPPVQELIKALGDALGPILDELGPVLVELAGAFGELILAALPLLSLAGELIAELLPSLIPLIRIVSDIIEELAPVIAMAAEGLELLLLPILEDMAEFLDDVVVPAVKGFLAIMQGDFTTAAEIGRDVINGMIDSQVHAFGTLPDRVRPWLDDFITGTTDAGRNAASGLLRGVRGMLNELTEQMGKVPGIARSQLSGIGSTLYNAGADLIRGFINGIRDMIGGVRSTLSDLTSNLTSWKGPEDVDKRILRPAGRLVLGGFIDGIDDLTPALRSQLQGLTSDLPGFALPDMAMAGAMSMGAAGGYGAPTRVEVVTRNVLDVRGGDDEMVRLIRKWADIEGGGDVQEAFGKAG